MDLDFTYRHPENTYTHPRKFTRVRKLRKKKVQLHLNSLAQKEKAIHEKRQEKIKELTREIHQIEVWIKSSICFLKLSKVNIDRWTFIRDEKRFQVRKLIQEETDEVWSESIFRVYDELHRSDTAKKSKLKKYSAKLSLYI
jgi:hypothetical protein